MRHYIKNNELKYCEQQHNLEKLYISAIKDKAQNTTQRDFIAWSNHESSGQWWLFCWDDEAEILLIRIDHFTNDYLLEVIDRLEMREDLDHLKTSRYDIDHLKIRQDLISCLLYT